MSVKTNPKIKELRQKTIDREMIKRMQRLKGYGELFKAQTEKLSREMLDIEQPIELESRKLLRLLVGEPFQRGQLTVRLKKHYRRRDDIDLIKGTSVIRELLEVGLIEISGEILFRNRDRGGWDKVRYYSLTEEGRDKATPIRYPPNVNIYETLPSALANLQPIKNVLELE